MSCPPNYPVYGAYPPAPTFYPPGHVHPVVYPQQQVIYPQQQVIYPAGYVHPIAPQVVYPAPATQVVYLPNSGFRHHHHHHRHGW